ncbi:hypothetical protein SLS54_010564 [Diplodia seriata]
MSGHPAGNAGSPPATTSKRPLDDKSYDISPTSKKIKVAGDCINPESEPTLIGNNRKFFDNFKRLPPKLRNQIYDVILAPIRPRVGSSSNKELVHINRTLYCHCLSEGWNHIDSSCQSNPSCIIRTISLRHVPAVRAEFMDRLWSALNIGFISSRPRGRRRHRVFTFLKPAGFDVVTYELDRYDLHETCAPFSDTFLDFVRALEQMAFNGTVRLDGCRAEVELARCYIDRTHGYWRRGNSLEKAHELCGRDGVWCLTEKTYRSIQHRMLLKLNRGDYAEFDNRRVFDMRVDFRPEARVAGIPE